MEKVNRIQEGERQWFEKKIMLEIPKHNILPKIKVIQAPFDSNEKKK